VNIVASDLQGSLDFYRRLGVSLPEPPKNKAGELFHANGDIEGGLTLIWTAPHSCRSGTKGGAVDRISLVGSCWAFALAQDRQLTESTLNSPEQATEAYSHPTTRSGALAMR
jgi:hypothetical protein